MVHINTLFAKSVCKHPNSAKINLKGLVKWFPRLNEVLESKLLAINFNSNASFPKLSQFIFIPQVDKIRVNIIV